MKALSIGAFLFLVATLSPAAPMPLFDGKTFAGWEGDTNKTFRIQEGAIVGGSLKEQVPHNDFLCTTRSYTNFVLEVDFRLVGTNGFINGGVQVRSQRVPNNFELSGYQADAGDGYWGSLYDESRRNKTLLKPDDALVSRILKKGDWNHFKIQCLGRHIEIWMNGEKTVDYTEPDEKIPQFGIIGLQIHGGGMAEAWYKNLRIDEKP